MVYDLAKETKVIFTMHGIMHERFFVGLLTYSTPPKAG